MQSQGMIKMSIIGTNNSTQECWPFVNSVINYSKPRHTCSGRYHSLSMSWKWQWRHIYFTC